MLFLSRVCFLIWHFQKVRKWTSLFSLSLSLSECLYAVKASTFTHIPNSQCAYKVNSLLSVTQRHMASWRSCGLEIFYCWHFSYEIHIPCCCSLDIWVYDPKHSALQRVRGPRQTHTVYINVLAAWSEKTVYKSSKNRSVSPREIILESVNLYLPLKHVVCFYVYFKRRKVKMMVLVLNKVMTSAGFLLNILTRNPITEEFPLLMQH